MGLLTGHGDCPERTKAQRDEGLPKATQQVNRKPHPRSTGPGVGTRASRGHVCSLPSCPLEAGRTLRPRGRRPGLHTPVPSCSTEHQCQRSMKGLRRCREGPGSVPLEIRSSPDLRKGRPSLITRAPQGGNFLQLVAEASVETFYRLPCWGPCGGVGRHLGAQNGLWPIGSSEPGLRGTAQMTSWGAERALSWGWSGRDGQLCTALGRGPAVPCSTL